MEHWKEIEHWTKGTKTYTHSQSHTITHEKLVENPERKEGFMFATCNYCCLLLGRRGIDRTVCVCVCTAMAGVEVGWQNKMTLPGAVRLFAYAPQQSSVSLCAVIKTRQRNRLRLLLLGKCGKCFLLL